jgi:D-alanyl-D-alanine carboxypeptidase
MSSGTETTAAVKTTVASLASTTMAPPVPTTTTPEQVAFPVATFAAIGQDPVTEELASKFQAAVEAAAGGGGVSATVMTAEGTWSGTTGKADGVRDLGIDDQFSTGSVTKSVVAAQMMLMVEAGELGLDDLAADHLPRDLQFDSNGATIRDLLSHRSGIPDYFDAALETLAADLLRVWTPADLLELVPTTRTPVGGSVQYGDVNYLLLGLVIEQATGRSLAEVLRDGALAIGGVERLVYQPHEKPTEPMAMPGGESTAVLEIGGGYLPSIAAATVAGPAAAVASDSPSMARWWRAFCAGEIVSQASLTEMSAFPDVEMFDGGYGLGLFNPAHPFARAVGHTGVEVGVDHTGETYGYQAWAACLLADEAVIVVLTNREAEFSFAFLHGMVRPLVDVLRSS